MLSKYSCHCLWVIGIRSVGPELNLLLFSNNIYYYSLCKDGEMGHREGKWLWPEALTLVDAQFSSSQSDPKSHREAGGTIPHGQDGGLASGEEASDPCLLVSRLSGSSKA